jgi:hypothetical protein
MDSTLSNFFCASVSLSANENYNSNTYFSSIKWLLKAVDELISETHLEPHCQAVSVSYCEDL